MRNTTELEQNIMGFLNELRDTGATNMWGATNYILDEFDVEKKTAKETLALWMSNFNEEGNYEKVKI